jgi:hypothetical protein
MKYGGGSKKEVKASTKKSKTDKKNKIVKIASQGKKRAEGKPKKVSKEKKGEKKKKSHGTKAKKKGTQKKGMSLSTHENELIDFSNVGINNNAFHPILNKRINKHRLKWSNVSTKYVKKYENARKHPFTPNKRFTHVVPESGFFK